MLYAGAAAWLLFGALTALVVSRGGAPFGPDSACLSWAVGHRSDTAVKVARALTATGSGVVPYTLVALAGLALGRTPRERARAALLCVAFLAVGQSLRYGVMEAVHRARPPHTFWATDAGGYAFPSGHTSTSAMTAGVLITALSLCSPRVATPLRALAACWAVAIGLTRVYLGVHWSTDVLGGWLFATGWLALCLGAATRWPPPSSGTGPARAAEVRTEDHAPEDPGR
ncbi:phosphoesterase [Streptomyces mangrovisoli]|uniref:Phosphoesterase n=1 Tax=Streptomyces mangrovisoli TaxID=1428628 RepID=A0A1J4NPM5_9ACTN|nr:phosphoesterase [Streptomyces mangrovisoli]